MSQSYFVFKGIDSRSMGIMTKAAAPIVRGEEAVQHVTIPGRAGELTITEGKGVFRSYIQTISISVERAASVQRVLDWLTGEGWVTFSGEPDKRQRARVIGAVTLSKLRSNFDRWQGEVQFYCEPLKEQMGGDTESISRAAYIVNRGMVPARPRITATFPLGGTVIITHPGGTFNLDTTGLGITSAVIDCDAQEVTSADGSQLITVHSSGPFPVWRWAPTWSADPAGRRSPSSGGADTYDQRF